MEFDLPLQFVKLLPRGYFFDLALARELNQLLELPLDHVVLVGDGFAEALQLVLHCRLKGGQLISLLLAHQFRVVLIDRIIEQVWDGTLILLDLHLL